MNRTFCLSLRRSGALTFLCFLLVAAPGPAPAAQVASLAKASLTDAAPPCSAVVAAGPVLATSWWNRIYRPVEHYLSSRAALLQFGAVGMFIALFIIMRNKW